MKDQKSPRHPAGARELRQAFAAADRDHDGRIDFAEFERLLDDLQGNMSKQDLTIGFREVDTDHDGFIDVVEFIDWWSSD